MYYGRKRWKRRARTVWILVLALGAGTFPCAPGPSFVSAAPGDTQQQINEARQQRENLENQQEENEDRLEGLKGVQSSLRQDLEGLNSAMTQVVDHLEQLEQQIRDKEEEIVQAQKALEQARETEAWQYSCMVARARAMYEYRAEDYLAELLSAGNLSSVLNAADYIERIAASDRKLMDDYQENRELIEEQEARLQREKVELDNLKADAEEEKNKVAGLISQTSNSINATAEQIAEAEKRAKEYEEEIKRADENLEALYKKLAEELALSQAAANAAWRDISEVTFADGDRKLLANLIYCEAGGEPYEGKLAVGAVVINRVLSAKFPDSVVGVIYQNRQFSPVASGRLDLYLSIDKANADCYRAADEAMSGATNVGTCLFFRTPIPGLTGINIGGHVFY